ncbi:hypothetical protein [Actinomadura hibisca]|uniref:hypothetical protein n=1 Tax=Actinomadura hibisca TaxID=68565 RepID=UPI00082F7109|nr:hypothetical protein [Actinomadura hibisca]
MTPELERAVAEAYAVFGAYRTPTGADFCAHCLRPEQVAALRAVPLPDLTEAHLDTYLLRAMNTWGGEAEFKHYLPRMLELLARDEWSDARLLAARCGLAWPPEEGAAVAGFFDAWLRSALLEYPRLVSFAQVLDVLCELGRDLGGYLALWERTATPGTVRHIAELIVYPPDDPALHRWLGGDAVGDLLLEHDAGAEALAAHDLWRAFRDVLP